MTSSVSPADAAVALRSLHRRYRAALQPIDDPQVDEWAERVGPDGSSALDHLVQASRGIIVVHQALRQALNASSPPTLPPGVLDASARDFDTTHATSVDAELGLLADEAEAAATTVTDAPGDAWKKTATVAGGGGEVTTLQLLAELVRTGVDQLKAAQQAFDQARRQSS
jgi:hypothetical protein